MGRDEQILDAACRLFYERGFAGVGVDEIGARAGISGPAIYRHFASKHEILATLFDQTMDLLLERVGGTFDDPRVELEHLVRGHLGFTLERPELLVVYHREGRSLVDPFRARWRRRESRYVDRWRDCVQRCYPMIGEKEAAAATAALTHLLNSVPEWPAEARQIPDLEDFVTAVGLAGLGVLAPDPRAAPSSAG